jgi:hypothetical protein
MPRIAAFFLLLIPQIVAACTCAASRSACEEVATSNAIFIGTVVAIEPTLLDRWKPPVHANWLNDPELVKLQHSKTPAALKTLKERYLALLFDLPVEERKQIESAATQEKLQAVMGWILHEGTRVRFRVRTTFQGHKDDDDDSDSDKAKKDNPRTDSEFIEVWNEPGDCGISFQKGETYLVYANDDEETERLETNICHRTARVSDSGEDLTYLNFYQHDALPSARLEGFITSEMNQLNLDRFHYSGKIPAPVSDVVVELKSSEGARYTAPDSGGRFVFDGLAQGDYQVSVFDGGFPDFIGLLSGPKRVRMKTKGCTTTTLLLLTHSFER